MAKIRGHELPEYKDGSNVDIQTYRELDDALREVHQGYDEALSMWNATNDIWIEAKLEYEEAYAEAYHLLRQESDKITLIKKDSDMAPRVRKAFASLLKAEGAKEYAERLLRAIDAQRSATQSRVKMFLSQLSFDQSEPQ